MAEKPKSREALSKREFAAWGGFLHTYKTTIAVLDAELERELGLSLSSYEVLLRLHNEPGGRIRMSELAEAVLLTRSGMTRLVDRLERDGLVERVPCPSDGRGLHCSLTRRGAELFERAQPNHLAGVRARFLSPLKKGQQRVLAEAWEAVRGEGEEPPPSSGDEPAFG